jgi:hypothetical protein
MTAPKGYRMDVPVDFGTVLNVMIGYASGVTMIADPKLAKQWKAVEKRLREAYGEFEKIKTPEEG